jgi:hypothetical protein
MFFACAVQGQKVLTTNSGQRILLVDNGSWRLLSVIENIDDETSELGTNLESFKSTKHGKYPINADQRKEIQKLLTNFFSDEAQLLVNIEMSKRKLVELQEEIPLLKKDKDQLEKVKYKIASSKIEIENNQQNYKAISALIITSNNLLAGKVKNIAKAYAGLTTDFNAAESINTGMGGTISENQNPTPKPNEDVESKDDKKYPTMFSIDNSNDGKDNYDCEIVFDGFDEDIGSNRKEVKTQRFFSFSQETMKPYFKTEDFLVCDGNISKVGKKYYLTLKIRIRSKDANKTYGTLLANENIKIELINGRRVYGLNVNSDSGEIESYTGNTLYTGIFVLDKSDVNDLKKNYLDHIGVIWSSGYEQYDIYNVDFLTNQLKCLTK